MDIVPVPVIPYKVISDCFRDRTVVPFLGAAASFVGAPAGESLPSGAGLAHLLVEPEEYPGSLSDPLTKVAQYLEEVQADREYILTVLCKRFFEQVRADYRTSVTEFLADIPVELIPELIITTNYDALVERALEERGVRYFAICHILKGSKYAGRLLCYESLRSPLNASNVHTLQHLQNQLQELEGRDVRPVLIYKMHGTARVRFDGAMVDSVVLTENDYIDFFAQELLNKIPTRIIELLRTGRLLFLGYALEDWNFRVLLRKLQLIQRQEREPARRH